MKRRALGVYREPQFSPGKVDADAAILDAVLDELAHHGMETAAVDAERFAASDRAEFGADLILAMCQSERALRRLAEAEASGAVAINSALAIRNCYRDLLGAGLLRAGVPTPEGALMTTAAPDLRGLTALDLDAGVYVKRGDLHALGPDDVQRADGRAHLLRVLEGFARRRVRSVYVQQAVEGRTVKFYGVSGGEYFTVVAEEGEVSAAVASALANAAATTAVALGLDAWGGDALLSGGTFSIVDFNDWPSFSRVRGDAARAVARRAMKLLARIR